MRHLLPVLLSVTAIVGFGSACYEDEFLSPDYTQSATRVFLKGTPCLYDEVASVEVYVVEISASTRADSASGQESWIDLASPMRRFDLLQLPGDRLALAGEVLLPTDMYYGVRLTIDSDSSVVRYNDSTDARVRWPQTGNFTAFASVKTPIAVPDSGISIVVVFDVAQSLIGGLGDPLHDFLFLPAMRAVDSAVTGALKGAILGDIDGDGFPEPVENAWVLVFDAVLPSNPESWTRISSGRTDSTGFYSIGFLSPGSYTVQIDTPDAETFRSLLAHDVEIVSGEDFVLSLTLPAQTVGGILIRR